MSGLTTTVATFLTVVLHVRRGMFSGRSVLQ